MRTANRIGKIEARPEPLKTPFLLASAGERVWKHSLCGLIAGKIARITAANVDDVTKVYYTDEQLAADQFNARVHAGDPYKPVVDALSGISVFLDTSGVFAPGDEGKDVFLVDDHTVTLTDEEDGTTPYVGKLTKVVTPTMVIVNVGA